MVGAKHARNPSPSLKQARRKAQPHARQKGSPRDWSPPPVQVAPGRALEDLSAWGDHPASHTGSQNLCAVRVCGAASSPAGNSSSVGCALIPQVLWMRPWSVTWRLPAPGPMSCTWGTCLFLSRMGGNSFLPSTPAIRVHTSHIGILVNGVKRLFYIYKWVQTIGRKLHSGHFLLLILFRMCLFKNGDIINGGVTL